MSRRVSLNLWRGKWRARLNLLNVASILAIDFGNCYFPDKICDAAKKRFEKGASVPSNEDWKSYWVLFRVITLHEHVWTRVAKEISRRNCDGGDCRAVIEVVFKILGTIVGRRLSSVLHTYSSTGMLCVIHQQR